MATWNVAMEAMRKGVSFVKKKRYNKDRNSRKLASSSHFIGSCCAVIFAKFRSHSVQVLISVIKALSTSKCYQGRENVVVSVEKELKNYIDFEEDNIVKERSEFEVLD